VRIAIIERMHPRTRTLVAGLALLGIFLVVYLPDLGHGFVKDDFGWVRRASTRAWRDLLLRSDIGFYRPLVMATFVSDHALYGLNAFGYGMTNLALCLGGAALFVKVARSLSLPTGAAMMGAAVWAFNFHGVNMGLLWLSGRTALLVVLFALATAIAMLRGRTWLGGLLCLGALLSKEEATLLPALWTAFLFLDAESPASEGRTGPLRRAAAAWPLWIALVVYLALRGGSGAFSALDAPDEYRLYSSLSLLGQNLAEYLDRAGTVFIGISLILLAVAGPLRGPSRAQPPAGVTAPERRALLLAALWVPATFALTASLPVRSSLYVLLPTVGSALVVAALASRTMRLAPTGFRRTGAALVVLALALVPVYRARNHRWVEDAELSAAVVEVARTAAARYPSGGRLVLVDDPGVRPNFDSAFLTAIPDMLTLFVGPQWTGGLLAEGDQAPAGAVLVALRNGQPVVVGWP
jgi:hypothetical protein